MRRVAFFAVLVCLLAFCAVGCNNSRPQLEINSYSDQKDGTAEVGYTIKMFEPTNISLVVNYSSDGGAHWLSATGGSRGDGTSNLATSKEGTTHTYIWNFAADLGAGLHKGVVLRLTPYAEVGRGKDDATGAFDVGSPFLYCANYGADTVSVVDTQKNVISKTISVGDSPYGVAALPNNLAVYVTNEADDTVSVIETATHTVVKEITVGSVPRGLVASPDGAKVYVVNCGKDLDLGTVSVIEVSSNSVVNEITVGTNPTAIAVTPAGTLLFVTNSGDDTVTAIDAATELPVPDSPVAVGLSPRGIACLPNGRYTYVCNYGDGTITNPGSVSVINNYRLDATPGTIEVGSQPESIVVSPDGAKIYVANSGSDNVSVIDAESLTVVDTVTVGNEPRGIAVSSDSATLFVTNFLGGSISRIDTASLGVVTITIGTNTNPIGVAILSK